MAGTELLSFADGVRIAARQESLLRTLLPTAFHIHFAAQGVGRTVRSRQCEQVDKNGILFPYSRPTLALFREFSLRTSAPSAPTPAAGPSSRYIRSLERRAPVTFYQRASRSVAC